MSDDFFSNVPLRRSSPDNDPHNDFAHAISIRFGSTDLRTARLLPDDLPAHHVHPSTPLPAPQPHSLLPQPPPPPPSPPQTFSPVSPSALAPYLADPHSLILDIRPHAAHAAARINNAVSLSVPTTLLKRPLFSLSKLSQMLPSPSSRARFADWPSASRILVYDSDSTHSPDNSIICGLLRKFCAEGFTGELSWLRGGFLAVWREHRELATTEPPPPEEDDPDAASLSGTLRTTHLPKAAFSLFSTTIAPPLQLGAIVLPNTPAPSASRAANPFFDTIRQNVELSHGITERIPLRLPRRVRRRINDLPSRWLQDIARRSALRPSSTSRHPCLDSLESGSESSDDPHTSDPDENDPDVEEGAEALAMQFYRIELAEQRRLRSIMEHHTRESQVHGFAAAAKHRRDGGGLGVRTGAKSVPSTPHPHPHATPFPFSITAAVEKGTKNRYTHIWPFEHARVRLHDGRHQGSYVGRRDRSRASARGRSVRDQPGGKSRNGEEQGQQQDKHRRSRSSPAYGKGQDREITQVVGAPSKHSLYFEAWSTSVALASLVHPTTGASVPQVNIEYDNAEQDPRTSGPPTPATALPLVTPPFYTPMEILPPSTPVRSRPPQLPSGISVIPGGRLAGAQVAMPTSSLPCLGPLPSFPLRLPNRPEGLLPSIGEQAWASSQSISSMATPFTSRVGTDGEDLYDTGTIRDLRREPSPVDDYVNASYVQPLCTRKRYIATQGPLPSTYVDFWTLVWEQNVHVIVMLTREVENAMVKCGSYWTDNIYGPLRLQLLSTSPPMSPGSSTTTMDVSKQGFFAIRETQGGVSGGPRDQPTLIARTFLLSHTSYPGVPPRTITHLQYLDWSDMNVPDDPRGVLDLVKKVEQAVAESTPSPSPSGSLSPGSGSSSLSGGQSPDIGPDQKGYDTSLLSPTSAGFLPGGTKGRHGCKWRHPELDSKCGIAAFALGKPAPVLLHCSAGVGRTGGFIAVDAMLDGIKRELRKNREERRMKKAVRIGVMAPVGMAGANNLQARELSVESAETGVRSVESCTARSTSDESERMDVDKSVTDKVEKAWDPLHLINTVPIHVSAGDRAKGRKRHRHSKHHSSEKQSSSTESLVVHVPYAGTNDVSDGTNTGIDLGTAKEADWQSSTREWVEKVSDQTPAQMEEESLPPPSMLPPPLSRERSPGSTSNSSDPSALNSADDSMSGSAIANASESAGARRGVGNTAKRKSDTGSASASRTGGGSGRQAPSSVSRPGSGSISHSTSGSRTGTGSQIGSSLLRARLRDSPVTSLSAESTDSLSPECDPKSNLHRAKVVYTKSNSDMEVDFPSRPVSELLQPYSSSANLWRESHSRCDKPMLGPLPLACFSSPNPPVATQRGTSFFGSDVAEGPISRPSSDVGSDEQANSEDFESGGSVAAEVSGRLDARKGLASSLKSEISLRLNPKLNALNAAETFHSGDVVNNELPPSRHTKGKERAIQPSLRSSDDPAWPSTGGVLGPSGHDQRATDHPVIDYMLPRELHSDLSPPLVSSFSEPIFTIVQDMREQRMSLCQSLRQYVFIHAAIIEGALRIVDEERKLWGYCEASDDSSSAEADIKANTGKGNQWPRHSEAKVWLGGVVAMRLVPEQGGVPPRTPPLHTRTQPSNPRGSESSVGGGPTSLAPASSSSGVSSPSKGKRAPSPTELLREDKTGALTLNKRPSINRKRMNDEDDQISFESSTSPVTGEDGGGLRDAAVGVSGTRSTAVPEKGGHTLAGAR